MERKGGIRIGWYGASTPLVTLRANEQELRIKILAAAEYIFSPSQVVSFEVVGSIPILTQGVRIRHTVKDYPENIVFYPFGSAEQLVTDITNQKFIPQGTLAAVPQRSGMPLKLLPVVLLIALWNGLFLIDKSSTPSGLSHKPGPLSLLALIIFFLISISILKSKSVQSIVLKPGRSIGEIRHLVSLVTLVSGMLSLIFGFMLLTGAFN